MSWEKITPTISTTAVTCATTIGSSTVTSSAAFGSVVAGQRIVGAGIPFMSKVLSKADASTITIGNLAGQAVNATATSASVSLRFGYFTSAIYAAGDALGFPFVIGTKKITNVVVVDAAKVITAVKLLVFGKPFTETADNAAFAPSDADAANLIGYLSLATSEVFANNQIVTGAATGLPIDTSGFEKYGQLIVVGTPTFLTVSDLTVNILGE